MSKAEELAEKALKAYPSTPNWDERITRMYRSGFIEGYHQAEKDLELTWENMREIYCITLNLREHLGASVFGEPLYQEVLKRFKERKENDIRRH